MTRRLTSSTSAVCLVMAALVLTVAASSPAAPILPPLKFARAVTEVHRGRCEAVLDDLHALSEEAGPTGGRASYLLAHCLLKRGDIDAARRAFDRVAEHFPPLADHARLYAAEAVMQSGQSEEAAARLEQLLTATPVSSVARRARLIYADALIPAGGRRRRCLVSPWDPPPEVPWSSVCVRAGGKHPRPAPATGALLVWPRPGQ